IDPEVRAPGKPAGAGDDVSLGRTLQRLPDLPRELMRLLEQIPVGMVTTYGDAARGLGDVRAARWVGEYLLAHPHHEGCPCHRVVRTDGSVGLYCTRSSEAKIGKLRDEGVCVSRGRVDLQRYRFDRFQSPS